MSFKIGSTDAEARFRERNSRFFEGSDVLERAIAGVFDREFTSDDTAQIMIFFIGHRCAEDFREVGLLAANGHGWGATAHLRGMYERAVVASFLKQDPAASIDFVDYDLVRRWKAAQAIKRTFNIDAEDENKLRDLESEFNEVRSRFEVTDCEKCGTKRLNHTWHKLDFVSMAGKTGKLGSLMVPAYYMPLAQAHGTAASVAYRVGEVDEAFAIDEKSSDTEADRSFQFSHLIMLNVLTIQQEFFELQELSEPLGQAYDHYKQAWLSASPEE